MRAFALAFAVLTLIAGAIGFAPVPTALAGVAKMLFFTFALLALISLVTHLSFERGHARTTSDERTRDIHRGPLDRH